MTRRSRLFPILTILLVKFLHLRTAGGSFDWANQVSKLFRANFGGCCAGGPITQDLGMTMTKPLTQLPPVFCWTKMGTESGEALSNIILRKEWERGLGNGCFYWGIGQSLGKNAEHATQNGSLLTAIFSPMPSKPQRHDVTPSGVYLWNAYIDATGNPHSLPLHAFVTSGASTSSGAGKLRQYALVCTCSRELHKMKSNLVIPLHALRNVSTGNPLGASQVTAVVSYRACDEHADGRRYPVSFSAHLKAPYFVQLSHPSQLGVADVAQVEVISRAGDFKAWAKLVERLRKH